MGQLTAVVNPAGDSVAYGYNGVGMRVRRTQAGVTTRYLYDGDDLAAELDVNGNPIRTYRYWPGIDQPHNMRQNGTTHYYAPDLPSSNVRGLFNVSGVATHTYSYGPFGEAQGASGNSGQPLRFAARELDATAGLYYVRARWYDAGMGGFISEDPIGLAGGINNYAYAPTTDGSLVTDCRTEGRTTLELVSFVTTFTTRPPAACQAPADDGRNSRLLVWRTEQRIQ